MSRRSTKTTLAAQFVGLMFCVLLMQNIHAAENLTASDNTIGNATIDYTSVGNVTQETIQIQSSYLSDTLEAGKEYNYQIQIKNVATRDVTIDPKLYNYNPNVGYQQAFGNDSIEIHAPSTIKAGTIANMDIRIHVPENATGSFDGYININIDGQVNEGSVPQIGLYFSVWRQTKIAYIKTFRTTTDAPITIEISSYKDNSGIGLRITPKDNDPSFDIRLTHDSSPVNLIPVKSVEGGSINVGSYYPLWAIENGNLYQDSIRSHVETYKVQGAIGNWELSILPKNTNNFGYSITIGDCKSDAKGDGTTGNTTVDNITHSNTTEETNQFVTEINNITESDNGKSINIRKGENFSIKLRENPSTGYSWQLNLSKGLCILSDNYTQDPAPSGRVGVSGTHLWIIKAVTKGSQQVRGIYKQPWMKTTGMEENFALDVKVF